MCTLNNTTFVISKLNVDISGKCILKKKIRNKYLGCIQEQYCKKLGYVTINDYNYEINSELIFKSNKNSLSLFPKDKEK